MSLLEHYCRNWSLSDATLLTESPTSQIYRATLRDEPVILKILTPLGKKDETFGALALQRFDGQGAVRLIRHDDGAHLLERVEGPDLRSLVEQGRDAEATSILADVLVAMHGRPRQPDERLPSLRERYRSLLKMAGQASSLYRVAAALAEKLLAAEREPRVLHGDLHHQNVLLSRTRGWLAIDPKGIYGDRTYDAANTLFNPAGSPELVIDERRLLATARILADRARLDFQRLLAFAFTHGCLSACWSIEDGEDPEPALQAARIAQTHLV